MAEVIINYVGNEIKVQCNRNDKMKVIIDQFFSKSEIKYKTKNFFFTYNGKLIDKELTFEEQANFDDKIRNRMNVIANKIDDVNKINKIISNDIICPECKDTIFIKFNNYKINLVGCKQNHTKNNIYIIFI